MAVIRVQKTENYSVISNEHLRNKELSLKAKGLMTLMLSLPPEWDYSIGGLVAICKESHTSIRSAIKELEQNHYLVRERKNNEKGYFIYEYTLYETRQPHIGNTHTVKAHTDKEHSENRTQINKEKINKEELNTDNNLYIDNALKDINDWELKELYQDYLEMRKEIGSPLLEKGLKLLIQKNERLTNGDVPLQRSLLETAIINQWKSVYLPNEQEVSNNNELAEKKRFYNL